MKFDKQKALKRSEELKEVYRPVILDINKPEDNQAFTDLINSNNVFLHDEIEGQLKELMKIRHPKQRLKPADYPGLIKQHLDSKNLFEYGLWVYYPWLARLVHILPQEEFIDLRTAANRNKITTAERNKLADKKIGVIGLSVGQSVALTIALERSCSEIRLADFDTLELNNLNRIRAGIQNLGLRKIYVVAREIAEIDPFIKTVCYTEGVTEENIHDFFTKNGKLDVVIDECDGVDVKILCRIKAKELHVPVIMEASDRGTLDVERFDLHPDRPIIHGWLEHLKIDFNVLKGLKTSEEKLPYILPISGLDTLSPRMKASMIEIEETITTWPQLASAVALGGAVVADTCRRVLLGQFTDSGRYFIDLEKLIPEKKEDAHIRSKFVSQPLEQQDIQKIVAELAAMHPNTKPVDASLVYKMVEAAIRAPSAGNNQPWRWHFYNNCLFLFHDKNRSVSFGDFEDIASYIALGAAIENLQLEASKLAIATTVDYFPYSGSKLLVAMVRVTDKDVDELYRPGELVKYIGTRVTNRNIGQRVPLDTAIYEKLSRAVNSVPGASLIIKTEEKDLAELGEIMGGAERLRLMHPEGHYEFYEKELRWTDEQSRTTADGIDIATVDISASEIVGLKLVKDPNVINLLTEWRGGKSLERIAKKSIAASSAIGLITMPEFSSLNYILGGRAVERMWLTATENGVSIQPMVAALLHFARLNHGNGVDMPQFMKEEFSDLYARFEQVFPGTRGRGEIFLFRIAMAKLPDVKSYRIPVDKIFTSE